MITFVCKRSFLVDSIFSFVGLELINAKNHFAIMHCSTVGINKLSLVKTLLCIHAG